MAESLSTIRSKLQEYKQDHLLKFYDELSELERENLLEQLSDIDFAALQTLIDQYVMRNPVKDLPKDLQPAPYYPFDPGSKYDADHYREIGEDLIGQGKVAAFTVAGGQGTRLGWNGPKGTFPATAITGRPLFRIFAEQLLATQKRYSTSIRWYIMTSPQNHAQTRAFFADNRFFGIDRQDIFMFPQGTMPCIDAATGKLLLSDKSTVAVNPDGHGGSIKALAQSGAIEVMQSCGIEHISYFQIDNPMVRAIDPLFIGLHAAAPDSSGEISSKMVTKTSPQEKVGVFCQSGGKTMVIEYSDLPDDLKNQTTDDGKLRFIAGSIAIHLLSVKFVEKLTSDSDGFALPFHRANKVVPYIDPTTGSCVEPDRPNAVKLETFVFDAIPLAESSIVYETSRSEEFAPIKNTKGVDSVFSSQQMQTQRAANWLKSYGVEIPLDSKGQVDAVIEISPLTALEAADLKKIDLPKSIKPGESIVL